jgi:hypothetical protein
VGQVVRKVREVCRITVDRLRLGDEILDRFEYGAFFPFRGCASGSITDTYVNMS